MIEWNDYMIDMREVSFIGKSSKRTIIQWVDEDGTEEETVGQEFDVVLYGCIISLFGDREDFVRAYKKFHEEN